MSGGGRGAYAIETFTVTAVSGNRGANGGSGGGGTHDRTAAGTGNLGGYSPVEGYAGGTPASGSQGGGGGGAAEAGNTDGAGFGGDGRVSQITGTTYAGGGAGALGSGATAEPGAGGGGTVASFGTLSVGGANNGATNTGSGGAAGFTNSGVQNAGAGGSGIVIIRYAIPDVTAPNFTSASSFSAAENIATSSNAATIKVSESATVTISAGSDAALFNIITSDSVTAFIRFKASPNFEAPSDVGANNVYEITLTATDTAANAGTQSITITVTDLVDTSAFNSLTLSGAATFRQVVSITANVSVASKVTFRARNIIIAGCKNKLTTGSSPNIVATCSWKPSMRGAVVITASAVPTGAGISSATATPVSVVVGNRVGAR